MLLPAGDAAGLPVAGVPAAGPGGTVVAPVASQEGLLPLWVEASREAERLAAEAAMPAPPPTAPAAGAAAGAGPAMQLGTPVDVPLFAPNAVEALVGGQGNLIGLPADARLPVDDSHHVPQGKGAEVLVCGTGQVAVTGGGCATAGTVEAADTVQGIAVLEHVNGGRRLKALLAAPAADGGGSGQPADGSGGQPVVLMAPPPQDMLVW